MKYPDTFRAVFIRWYEFSDIQWIYL